MWMCLGALFNFVKCSLNDYRQTTTNKCERGSESQEGKFNEVIIKYIMNRINNNVLHLSYPQIGYYHSEE